jgi:hypothetical protein
LQPSSSPLRYRNLFAEQLKIKSLTLNCTDLPHLSRRPVLQRSHSVQSTVSHPILASRPAASPSPPRHRPSHTLQRASRQQIAIFANARDITAVLLSGMVSRPTLDLVSCCSSIIK